MHSVIHQGAIIEGHRGLFVLLALRAFDSGPELLIHPTFCEDQ
jgi:hypothetical protein